MEKHSASGSGSSSPSSSMSKMDGTMLPPLTEAAGAALASDDDVAVTFAGEDSNEGDAAYPSSSSSPAPSKRRRGRSVSIALVSGTDMPPGAAASASWAVTADATQLHFCGAHLCSAPPAVEVFRRLTAAQLQQGGGGGGIDVETDPDADELPSSRAGMPNSISS